MTLTSNFAKSIRALAAPAFLRLSRHVRFVCGRVIQTSGSLRYGMVEGMRYARQRAHNYPPRWKAAPSQDLLVIWRNYRPAARSFALGPDSMLVQGPHR